MAAITMRINDADAAIVQRYAQLKGKTVSDFVRDAVFEKIENERYLTALHAAIPDDDSERLIQYQVLAELRL
ncbi:MAG: DUF1778 domain-containing protein [Eggerthellaceae bacterium]|nr:DUF1778 domain-containing protein [Eggerthellaceae bacterium]